MDEAYGGADGKGAETATSPAAYPTNHTLRGQALHQDALLGLLWQRPMLR
jgi:hypothetical protein